MTRFFQRWSFIAGAALAFVGVSFAAWSGSTGNWWICSWKLGAYNPDQQLDVFVPTKEQPRYYVLLRQFAEENHLKFFVDDFDPGVAGVKHGVKSMQIFGCQTSIYIANNWHPEIFGIRTSVSSNSVEGKKINSNLLRIIRANYKTIDGADARPPK